MAGFDERLKKMLGGYDIFVQEKELSLSKHQAYLVRWVKDFLLFAKEHGGYTFEQTLDLFLAEVGGRLGTKPWQIKHPDETAHLYLFGPVDDPVLVAWRTEVGPARKIEHPKEGKAGSALDATLDVELPAANGTVGILDWQGRRQRQAIRDKRLRLQLRTWPQYIPGVRGLAPQE